MDKANMAVAADPTTWDPRVAQYEHAHWRRPGCKTNAHNVLAGMRQILPRVSLAKTRLTIAAWD